MGYAWQVGYFRLLEHDTSFRAEGSSNEFGSKIRAQISSLRYALAFFQKLAPCLIGIEACATSHHSS